jgi:hypothetical protein
MSLSICCRCREITTEKYSDTRKTNAVSASSRSAGG